MMPSNNSRSAVAALLLHICLFSSVQRTHCLVSMNDSSPDHAAATGVAACDADLGNTRPIPLKVDQLDIASFEIGKRHHLLINIKEDGVGSDISVPVIVARGARPGPVVAVTAAIHGNELNGIRVIHKLFDQLDVDILNGTIVAVTVVNVPGYLANTREFYDGQDLNRVMPGKDPGSASQVYAHRFVERVIKKGIDYLIDLHTASFGRVNSFYIRANMNIPVVADLAKLMDAEIIVHSDGEAKTLRKAAEDLGIHALTVEVGDPQRFQRKRIRSCLLGIQRILGHLKMYDPAAPVEDALNDSDEDTVSCKRSYWMYTEDEGGLLEVFPPLASHVEKGQVVARLSDVYGNHIRDYYAPEKGVVVGKSDNPVAHTGARILHLGVAHDEAQI